ncbi:unnamed protein product [Closterium sp. Naga37s-1]|nr:unnamed protein product [Closterium sp. Naga37s-1]
MNRRNSLRAGIWAVPFFFTSTSFIVSFYVFARNSRWGFLNEEGVHSSNIGLTFAITGAITGATLIFSVGFLVPFFIRRLEKEESLRWYHVFCIHWLPEQPHDTKIDTYLKRTFTPQLLNDDEKSDLGMPVEDEEEEHKEERWEQQKLKHRSLVLRLAHHIKWLLMRTLYIDVASVQRRNKGAVRAHEVAVLYDNKTEYLYSLLQVVTASFASFSHGSNDVAGSLGPLAGVYQLWETGTFSTYASIPYWMLVNAGLMINLGLALYGYNIMRNLGNNITYHSPSRGFSMELGTALAVLTASFLALPVSTTQCIVGATVAVGLCNGKWRAINWGMVAIAGFGWVITLPVAVITASLLAQPVSTTQCIVGATVAVGLCNGKWRAINWGMVAIAGFGWVITLPVAGLPRCSGVREVCVQRLDDRCEVARGVLEAREEEGPVGIGIEIDAQEEERREPSLAYSRRDLRRRRHSPPLPPRLRLPRLRIPPPRAQRRCPLLPPAATPCRRLPFSPPRLIRRRLRILPPRRLVAACPLPVPPPRRHVAAFLPPRLLRRRLRTLPPRRLVAACPSLRRDVSSPRSRRRACFGAACASCRRDASSPPARPSAATSRRRVPAAAPATAPRAHPAAATPRRRLPVPPPRRLVAAFPPPRLLRRRLRIPPPRRLVAACPSLRRDVTSPPPLPAAAPASAPSARPAAATARRPLPVPPPRPNIAACAFRRRDCSSSPPRPHPPPPPPPPPAAISHCRLPSHRRTCFRVTHASRCPFCIATLPQFPPPQLQHRRPAVPVNATAPPPPYRRDCFGAVCPSSTATAPSPPTLPAAVTAPSPPADSAATAPSLPPLPTPLPPPPPPPAPLVAAACLPPPSLVSPPRPFRRRLRPSSSRPARRRRPRLCHRLPFPPPHVRTAACALRQQQRQQGKCSSLRSSNFTLGRRGSTRRRPS